MEHIWDIIAKDLSGGATAEEKQEIQAWLAQSPERKAELEAMQQAFDATAEVNPTFQPNADAAWEKMQTRLQGHDEKVIPIRSETAGYSDRNRWILRIAASLIILLGSVFAIKLATQETYKNQLSATDTMREVTLPDGSKVWLNKQSTIHYPDQFSDEQRLVKLEGEGFFEIKKNPNKPFMIETSETMTKVLGTSFNLRAYPNEKMHSIDVRTGKVSFSDLDNPTEEAILTVGDRADFERAKQSIAAGKIITPNAMIWQSKALDFTTSAPLRVIVKDLEHYFNVTIKVEDKSALACTHTLGKFENPELKGLLDVISIAAGFQYSIDGDVVTIQGGTCK